MTTQERARLLKPWFDRRFFGSVSVGSIAAMLEAGDRPARLAVDQVERYRAQVLYCDLIKDLMEVDDA